MSRSWGHAVRLLTDTEKAYRVRQDWPCSTSKCREMPTHATSYKYVTGRGGRVGEAERQVCTPHAERFAASHDLDMPTAPTPESRARVHANTLALLDAGPGRWWHAYGAAIGDVWVRHVYGDTDIPPDGVDDEGRPIIAPRVSEVIGLGPTTLRYLGSWNHDPSDDELAAVTPDEYREPAPAVVLARFVDAFGHAPKIRGKGGVPGGWASGPGGIVYRTDPSCGENRRPGEDDAAWYARLVEKEKAEDTAWEALCRIPDDDGYTPPPNVRDCRTCPGRVFVARSVDNHLMLLDVTPDPDGELQIYGAPLDQQPIAVYGRPGTTLAGEPLPDLTTYRRHACDDPYRAEGATS